MSTNIIFMYAIGVFSLMMIGIILTMIEFKKLTDDSSVGKGDAGQDDVNQPAERPTKPNVQVVHRNDNAARG